MLFLLDCCHAMAPVMANSRAKMVIAACGADQYATKPEQYSFTLCLMRALPVLTNNFETLVSVVDLQIYIDSIMKRNPNPWFPQDTRLETFSGTGDVWLARILEI